MAHGKSTTFKFKGLLYSTAVLSFLTVSGLSGYHVHAATQQPAAKEEAAVQDTQAQADQPQTDQTADATTDATTATGKQVEAPAAQQATPEAAPAGESAAAADVKADPAPGVEQEAKPAADAATDQTADQSADQAAKQAAGQPAADDQSADDAVSDDTVANPITNVEKQTNVYEVTYQNGQKAHVSVLTDKMFRYYVDPSGEYGDPAQSKEGLNAKIFPQALDDYDKAAFNASTLTTTDAGWTIGTDAIQIQFAKATGLMSVLHNNKIVLAESEPLEVTAGGSTQYLKDAAGSQYFGGGTQNGEFTMKGKEIKILKTNDWVDGGVASPNPFYWSTAGYGVVRNTFKPGTYNFDTANNGEITANHEEDRFDAVYFFDDTAYALIHDYQELTGLPALMPHYAFYEAHLNAYNRDIWVEVPEGTYGGIKFPDGKTYKEYEPDKVPAGQTGTLESLNGEKDNYQFSAREVIDEYIAHDMPLGWFLPNDGYGAGYGQTDSLAGNIENLKEFIQYANERGIQVGLWTQQNLKPVDPDNPTNKDRDFAAEVAAGVVALKTDVAWVGPGYSFGLDGIETATDMMEQVNGDSIRPFIITLNGWAGTQHYAGVWDGDQTGGEWEYIRFHIPTYIGEGLSGQPNVGSDLDGIFGGKNPIINIRDFQWKTFTPIELNMDGWGSNPKNPFVFDEATTNINRAYLKQKSMLMPYIYTAAAQSTFDGKPMVRALFLDYSNLPETYTDLVKYEYMWGDDFLVAPVYQDTNADAQGNDVRNGIYLPDANQVWIDYYTGKEYQGGQVINNFDAPIWKLPIFVKAGSIIATTPAHNTPDKMDLSQRQFQIYANGKTTTTNYEDDGISKEYLNGQSSKTTITSDLQGTKLTVTVDPMTGSYANMVTDRTTEFDIRSKTAPASVTATVGGKTVTLTAVDSLEAFNAGTNVYFYDQAYLINDYLKGIGTGIEQAFLRVKLGATDVTQNGIVLTVDGVDTTAAPVNALPAQNDAVPAVTNLTQQADTTDARQIGMTWDAVEGATGYNLKLDGVLHANVQGTSFILDGLLVKSDHTVQIQAITADGAGAWTDVQNMSTDDDPLQDAIKGIVVRSTDSNITGTDIWQEDMGPELLFDLDLNSTAHTNWFTGPDAKQDATPLSMLVELRNVYELDHFTYVPRVDGGNGTITGLDISVSIDGVHWSDPIQTRGWAANGQEKTVDLSGLKAYFVRFTVPKGMSVGQFVSGQEFLLFKKEGTKPHWPGDLTNDGTWTDDDETSLRNYAGLTHGKDSDFDGYVENGDMNQNGTIDAYDINYVETHLGTAVTTWDEAVPTGTLTLKTDKTSYQPGDTITVTLQGHDLTGVNALSVHIPYTSKELTFGNVQATDATKNMINFSKSRLHSDGSEDLYLIFSNKGEADRLSGDLDLATFTLTAKKPLSGDALKLALTDPMLVNQISKEAFLEAPAAVELTYLDPAKAGLRQSIATAKALNPEHYTADSWQAVADALTQGQTVADDSAADQVAIDTAQQSLIDAVKGLTPATHLDKAVLAESLKLAQGVDASGYTVDSQQALADAISNAAAVVGDDAATQDTIDDAAIQLTAALAGLKSKPVVVDKTAFQAAIAKAEKAAKDAAHYTAQSYVGVADALAAAQAVAANPNATAAQVEAATTALQEALAILKPVAQGEQTGKHDQGTKPAPADNQVAKLKQDKKATQQQKVAAITKAAGKKTLPKTGESTTPLAALGVALLSLLGGLGFSRRKQN